MTKGLLIRLSFAAALGGVLLLAHPQEGNAMGEVGTLQFSSGQNQVLSAVIDSSRTFAYFGDATGDVVQVQLSNFQVNASTITFSTGPLTSAVIHPDNQFAYFGSSLTFSTVTLNGFIASTQLEPALQLSTVTATTPLANQFTSAVIDSTGAFAYFGTSSTNTPTGIIVKIRLSDFVQVSSVALQTGENFLTSAVIDSSGAFAYFGTATSPGKVIQINLSTMLETNSLTLKSGENSLTSAVIDANSAFAYFGTSTMPGKVVKVALPALTETASINLQSGEDTLTSAVMDNLHGYAYFGTATSPGRVIRIFPSTLVEVNSLTLNTGENTLAAAVIDSSNSYAYFGAQTSPAEVIKVDILDTRTGPPVITGQPSGQSLNPGQSATLAIAAGGTAPLSYQWQLNNTDIPGASSTTYTVGPVALTDSGAQYRCIVTNAFGSATSNEAVVTVIPIVRVYPNPWRVDRHAGHPLIFDQLAPNSTVKIFTLSMHWVKTLTPSGTTATWDLTNDAGQNVASGYYFYLITTANDSQTVHGKLAVIK